MTKSVAILGCGPAGLLVAHAAKLCGWDFEIYSKKQKSQLFGAQYLHEPIPEITGTDPEDGAVMLRYRIDGGVTGYRHKVYGATWDGTVSPEDYLEEHHAWDIRSAYDKLWFEYGHLVREFDVDQLYWGEGMSPMQGTEYDLGLSRHDLVISTIPRTVWDRNDLNFEKTYVWALGDGDYERVHMNRPDPFTVVCDGTKENQWYRVSNIFGFCTMEWPYFWNAPYATVTPPARGAARVIKPLRYNGDSASDYIHLGRYAQWEKGVLTSDVFQAAMIHLQSDKIEGWLHDGQEA